MSRTRPPARALRPRRRIGIVLTPLVGVAAVGAGGGRAADLAVGAGRRAVGRLAGPPIAVPPPPIGAGR